MQGKHKISRSTSGLMPHTGGHRAGKSKGARIFNRQNERRLLKQSQEPKPNKPTKGFK